MVYFVARGFVRNKMTSQQGSVLTVIFSSLLRLCASPSEGFLLYALVMNLICLFYFYSFSEKRFCALDFIFSLKFFLDIFLCCNLYSFFLWELSVFFPLCSYFFLLLIYMKSTLAEITFWRILWTEMYIPFASIIIFFCICFLTHFKFVIH